MTVFAYCSISLLAILKIIQRKTNITISNTVALVHGYRYVHTRVTKQRVSVLCLQRDLFNQWVTAPLGCSILAASPQT